MTEQKKKTLRIITIVIIYLCTIVLSCLCTFFITRESCQPKISTVDAYQIAMDDVMDVSENEIFELVTITNDSQMVTWNATNDKVLMISWHRYPESYPNGSVFECEYGEIWAFTDREVLNWFQNNDENVSDWELRFEQLIGLPKEKQYTHFTAFWVDTTELIRPAYQPDVTKQVTINDLDGSALGEYKDWFNGNVVWSYVDSAYPWTRLGYTYDWTNDGKDYGLTEFIILPNSTIEVEWTITTAEFIDKLNQGSLLG